MAKLVAALAALLLSGSLGAAPGVGDSSQQAPTTIEPRGWEAYAATDGSDAETLQADSDSMASVPMGGMSEEEKERRRAVCEKQNDDCCQWCKRSIRDPKKRPPCYADCNEKLAECMKPIS